MFNLLTMFFQHSKQFFLNLIVFISTLFAISCHTEEEPCLYTPEVIDFFVRVTCAWEPFHRDGELVYHPVTKWIDNPRIKLFGQYTEEDQSIIQRTIDTLNAIQHQIELSLVDDNYNFEIHVLPKDQWNTVMPHLTPDLIKKFGGAYHIITKNGSFAEGDTIVYAYNVIKAGSYKKNSILMTELIQALGFYSDTYDEPKSVFYEPMNHITDLHPVDKLIISFFYSEHVVNGDTHEKFYDYVCWR